MHRFNLIHLESSSPRPCVPPASLAPLLPSEGFGDWHIKTYRNGSVHVYGFYSPANRADYYQGAVPFTVKLRRERGSLSLDVRAASHVEDFLFGLFLSSFAPLLRNPEAGNYQIAASA